MCNSYETRKKIFFWTQTLKRGVKYYCIQLKIILVTGCSKKKLPDWKVKKIFWPLNVRANINKTNHIWVTVTTLKCTFVLRKKDSLSFLLQNYRENYKKNMLKKSLGNFFRTLRSISRKYTSSGTQSSSWSFHAPFWPSRTRSRT